MVDSLDRLGFQIQVQGGSPGNVQSDAGRARAGWKNPQGGNGRPALRLFVGNAGTAARFLAALVCLGQGVYRLEGTSRMQERPQAGLSTPCANWATVQATNPMPADLPERICFSLALRDLEIEMARLADQDELTVAARGIEQSRTITFDSDSLTIMIRIEANRDGTVRVDGWLAPPQRREIEMKTAGSSLTVASDEQGRFAFAQGRGTAQLVVAAPAAHGPACAGRSVVTPALIL